MPGSLVADAGRCGPSASGSRSTPCAQGTPGADHGGRRRQPRCSTNDPGLVAMRERLHATHEADHRADLATAGGRAPRRRRAARPAAGRGAAGRQGAGRTAPGRVGMRENTLMVNGVRTGASTSASGTSCWCRRRSSGRTSTCATARFASRCATRRRVRLALGNGRTRRRTTGARPGWSARPRARLLCELDRPSTVTGVATRLGVTVGAVSQHLGGAAGGRAGGEPPGRAGSGVVAHRARARPSVRAKYPGGRGGRPVRSRVDRAP